VKALFSQRDDVTLAGGMGGITRGVEQVTKNIEVVAAQFREGRISFETLAKYATEDLGYLLEVERYKLNSSGVKKWASVLYGVQPSFGAKMGSREPFIGTATRSLLSGQWSMHFLAQLFQFKKRLSGTPLWLPPL
jgi:hypothetical protein